MTDAQDDVSFVVSFPLPFRVLFLIGLGIVGWGANLHGLHIGGINAVRVLGLRTNADDDISHTIPHTNHANQNIPEPKAVYMPIYRLGGFYGSFCLAAWVVYHFAAEGDPTLADVYKFIPSLCALVLAVLFLLPHNILARFHRDAFIEYVS